MTTPERIARIKRPHTMHHYAQPVTNQEDMTMSTTDSTPTEVFIHATITDPWGGVETVYVGSMPDWAAADAAHLSTWKGDRRRLLLAERTSGVSPKGWRFAWTVADTPEMGAPEQGATDFERAHNMTPTRRDDDDTTPRLPHSGHRATHTHMHYGLVRVLHSDTGSRYVDGDIVRTNPPSSRIDTGWHHWTVPTASLTPVTPELVPVVPAPVDSVAPAPAPRPTNRDGGDRP